MNIEIDKDLANTILEVQHVLRENGIEIGGPLALAKWEELVRISLSKVAEHPTFNIIGCQTGRFTSKFEKVS
jgi:hypothetical protein